MCMRRIPRSLTYVYGASFPHTFEIRDPDISIHFAIYDLVKSVILRHIGRPCIKGHTAGCACAESHELLIWVKNNYIFGILNSTLPNNYTRIE